MRTAVPLLALLAAGCSGAPLGEIPSCEPPPLAPPDPAPALPRIVGAWSSVAVSGPGSASIRRVVLVFEPDGRFSGAAFLESGSLSLAGSYTDTEGAVQADLGGGDVRLWSKELKPGSLVLREGDKEIRLAPLR